jgi:hypothetical protein
MMHDTKQTCRPKSLEDIMMAQVSSIYQSAQQGATMTPRSVGQLEPSSTGGRRARHVINHPTQEGDLPALRTWI